MLLIELTKNQIMIKIKELNNATSKGIRKALYNVGKYLCIDARKFIDEKPKHGRIYRIGVGKEGKKLKRLRNHIASAPGEAPAVITGALRKAIDFHVQESSQVQIGVAAPGNARHGAGVNYAKYLEYQNLIAASGAGGSKKIAPRPFISRAYVQNKQNIIKILEASLKNVLLKK